MLLINTIVKSYLPEINSSLKKGKYARVRSGRVIAAFLRTGEELAGTVMTGPE